jgi:SAM-dependent methyltransferase
MLMSPSDAWIAPLRAAIARRAPAPPTLVVRGDRGPRAAAARRVADALPDATVVTLPDYVDLLWSDVLADRAAELGPALLAFLAAAQARDPLAPAALPAGAGEVAGVTYRVAGSGPPLLLFPLDLAASQWEPLLPALAARHTVVTLGGAWLGLVAILEQRARGGYGAVVDALVDAVAPRPGEAILEVGCGSGAVARRLARRLAGANLLVGVDVSRYLLGEAATLARGEGLAAAIEFREGNAEALPFPDASVDVALACTVLEEGDAGRMLAELARVVRPGGRVGLVVRATDQPFWDSLPLRPELRAKVAGRPGAGAAARGCADASLYRRVGAAGLAAGWMGPRWGVDRPDAGRPDLRASFEAGSLGALSADEATEWRAAAAEAEAAGAYLWAIPYHCAVGAKPTAGEERGTGA